MGIKKHIPNTITCCNLISGCIATVFAFNGQFALALLWIVAGAVFDFFDGMTARLLHVSSPIGKELDSLADDVTFGVAPSAMVFYELSAMDYPTVMEPLRPYIPFFAFNLDERQTTSFIGLPTPANALFWGSLLVGASQWLESSPVNAPLLMLMVLLSCYLLVSEIPMFALKFKQWGWKGNEVKYIFVATAAALILLLGVKGIAVVIAWYVLLSAFVGRKSGSADPE